MRNTTPEEALKHVLALVSDRQGHIKDALAAYGIVDIYDILQFEESEINYLGLKYLAPDQTTELELSPLELRGIRSIIQVHDVMVCEKRQDPNFVKDAAITPTAWLKLNRNAWHTYTTVSVRDVCPVVRDPQPMPVSNSKVEVANKELELVNCAVQLDLNGCPVLNDEAEFATFQKDVLPVAKDQSMAAVFDGNNPVDRSGDPPPPPPCSVHGHADDHTLTADPATSMYEGESLPFDDNGSEEYVVFEHPVFEQMSMHEGEGLPSTVDPALSMPEGESLPTECDVVVPTTPSINDDALYDALQQHTTLSSGDIRSILPTNVANSGVSHSSNRA